ncbi:MAG TPA: methylmalonyl Co-A mutase-associated GTPase MeaB [Acidobacteriota bacterium]|nr:methylmalonyl Co-A mutase-associated GTPase MeaB [Acidobacteriota bacterium]
MPTQGLIRRIRSRELRAVAQTLSRVENDSGPETKRLLKRLYRHAGNAMIVGVTGSPGAGKSTLVDQLALHYRKSDKLVGIIAVDPSSPFSGGALLGDRIRMKSLATDSGVFIRSMATRGRMGGLSAAVHDAVIVLDAAGYDILLIETVGAGQDEIDIVKTAQVTVVVLVPGMGDDIQTIKAGMMEIGDVLVINKADRDSASRTQKELEALLSIGSREDGWVPPIVRTIAVKGEGIDQLAAAVDSVQEFLQSGSQASQERRLRLLRASILELLRDRMMERIDSATPEAELTAAVTALSQRRTDPYTVVENLLKSAGLEEE